MSCPIQQAQPSLSQELADIRDTMLKELQSSKVGRFQFRFDGWTSDIECDTKLWFEAAGRGSGAHQ